MYVLLQMEQFILLRLSRHRPLHPASELGLAVYAAGRHDGSKTWPTTETHEAEAAKLTRQLLEPKYEGCVNLTGDGTVRPAHLGEQKRI